MTNSLSDTWNRTMSPSPGCSIHRCQVPGEHVCAVQHRLAVVCSKRNLGNRARSSKACRASKAEVDGKKTYLDLAAGCRSLQVKADDTRAAGCQPTPAFLVHWSETRLLLSTCGPGLEYYRPTTEGAGGVLRVLGTQMSETK